MTAPCPNRSRACHARGCRDEGCVEAKRRYNRRSAKLCRQGRRALVDAGPVREHVRWLAAHGMGYRRVAAAAGMTPQGVQKIIGCGQRPAARVRRTTAAAILAVRPSPAGCAPVDATGTRRRIRALVRIGWTQARIGAEFGVDGKEVNRLLRHTDRVSRARAAQVAAVYDRLGMTYPTGVSGDRCRARGRRLGWASPLAWEGVDIDDPAAKPDTGGKRERRSASRPPTGEEAAA